MNKHLYILWTTDNINTAEHMVLMYAINSKIYKWWEDVTVIIWGAASTIIKQNESIQKNIRLGIKEGVKFTACRACASALDTKDVLRNLDIEIKYWGEPLTELIKNNKKIITV